MNTKEWTVYARQLRAFIAARVDDPTLADDLLQEVWMRAHDGLPTLKDDAKLLSWMFQITRNVLADHFRRQKRCPELSRADFPTDFSDTDADDEHRYFAQCVPGFLGMLPEKYREAVYWSDIRGLSQKELAAHLNLSYSGAKSRVQRGRQMLRQALLDCCEITTDVYGNVVEYEPRDRSSE